MARRLIWSGRALDDLDAILSYIARDSPAYARAVGQRMLARVESLPDQPRQGRRVPEYDGDRELREVFVHRWRLIYEVSADKVRIITVIHGARLLGNAGPL
ncbi:MAG TPA: type II toxin-antitoxin system RelE/ParE family toxin [Paracoccaceae bacterium]|nr:type II toxin-antitoxin system RelE/ParE family toxin [Paracoccaceae bacterium]